MKFLQRYNVSVEKYINVNRHNFKVKIEKFHESEIDSLKLSMLAQLSLVKLVFHNNVFAFIT